MIIEVSEIAGERAFRLGKMYPTCCSGRCSSCGVLQCSAVLEAAQDISCHKDEATRCRWDSRKQNAGQ